MLTISKTWLDANKTRNGAWTRAQLAALGVPWAEASGWRRRLIGEVISDEQARAFEEAVSIRAKKSDRSPRSKVATPAFAEQGVRDKLPLNHYRATTCKANSAQAHAAWRAQIPGAWIAWTDGACEPNPDGFGGWGFSLRPPAGEAIEEFGGERKSTNNRMEMLAVIEAIRECPSNVPLVVCTDSQLTLLCAVGRWKRKANLDLWKQMHDACDGRVVVFEWHKGHAGTPGNERADELAEMGRQSAIDKSEGW